MPDTAAAAEALRRHHRCARTRAGAFPPPTLLLLMDHASGLFIDCGIDSPLSTSDLSQTQKLHTHLSAGRRCCWGGISRSPDGRDLALLIQAKLHAVVEAPHHHLAALVCYFTPDRTHAHPRKGKSTSRSGKATVPVRDQSSWARHDSTRRVLQAGEPASVH